jgi:hypothetical protein
MRREEDADPCTDLTMEMRVGVWRVMPRSRGVMPSFVIIYIAV